MLDWEVAEATKVAEAVLAVAEAAGILPVVADLPLLPMVILLEVEIAFL